MLSSSGVGGGGGGGGSGRRRVFQLIVHEFDLYAVFFLALALFLFHLLPFHTLRQRVIGGETEHGVAGTAKQWTDAEQKPLEAKQRRRQKQRAKLRMTIRERSVKAAK